MHLLSKSLHIIFKFSIIKLFLFLFSSFFELLDKLNDLSLFLLLLILFELKVILFTFVLLGTILFLIVDILFTLLTDFLWVIKVSRFLSLVPVFNAQRPNPGFELAASVKIYPSLYLIFDKSSEKTFLF